MFNRALSEEISTFVEEQTGGVCYGSLKENGRIHLDGPGFTVDILKEIIALVELYETLAKSK